MYGSNPRFRIRGKLNFERCAAIYSGGLYSHRNYAGANMVETSPGRSNYWIMLRTEEHPITKCRELCYSVLMYSTYILTWWEDGTCQTRHWDSGITRSVTTQFGPIRVWNNSRCGFRDTTRWGNYHMSYPYGDGLVIPPDGIVTGLIDYRRRVKPECKKERRLLTRAFRKYAIPRVTLGEFDNFATRVMYNNRVDTFYAFAHNADHDVIEALLYSAQDAKDARPISGDLTWVFDSLIDATMCHERWFEEYPTEYGPVNVRTL